MVPEGFAEVPAAAFGGPGAGACIGPEPGRGRRAANRLGPVHGSVMISVEDYRARVVSLPAARTLAVQRVGLAEACGRAPGAQREEFLARLMDNARELLDRPATAWQKNKGA